MQSTILKEVTQRCLPQYNCNHRGFKNFNVYTFLYYLCVLQGYMLFLIISCFRNWRIICTQWGFPGNSDDKESDCNTRDPGSILGSGRSLGERNGNSSGILAWRISWTEEPYRLQSMGLQSVRHHSATDISTLLTSINKIRGTHSSWEHTTFCLSRRGCGEDRSWVGGGQSMGWKPGFGEGGLSGLGRM